LFNKQTVIKVIPVTELFEEYKVFTGVRRWLIRLFTQKEQSFQIQD
jgi:hypothetical protein